MLLPYTTLGIREMLDTKNIDVTGKHAVVVGSSNIVGKPVGQLLLNRFTTVTNCHIKTENLRAHTKMADILVVAVGNANMIKADDVKRSEEHTSELQSRGHLVCRLLLEKKKWNNTHLNHDQRIEP